MRAYCTRCKRQHSLPTAPELAGDLMRQLEQQRRIDIDSPHGAPDLSTDYLFGPARGQMFGVLECRDTNGGRVVLKAFSGQYNGIWEVEGWAPPLLNVRRFDDLVGPADREIKRLGREIDAHPGDRDLIRTRKRLSRELMKKIHALYELNNFCGETASLERFFTGNIPTGTGDCCAPKLLNQAARQDLTPLRMAEFYWGRENRSRTRRHGSFYPACREKCQPILGFMLCGCEERHV